MKGFTSSTVEAHQLMKDDWFKVAGQLIRVVKASPNADQTRMRIEAGMHPFQWSDKKKMHLNVPRTTKFKIYNQKQK